MLSRQNGVETFLDQPLACTRDRGEAVSRAFTIRLSLQPSSASETSASGRTRAFRIVAAGHLPFLHGSSCAALSPYGGAQKLMNRARWPRRGSFATEFPARTSILWTPGMIGKSEIREWFAAVDSDLNERSRRLLTAAEAGTAGHGGGAHAARLAEDRRTSPTQAGCPDVVVEVARNSRRRCARSGTRFRRAAFPNRRTY